jgi:hypothetical protein
VFQPKVQTEPQKKNIHKSWIGRIKDGVPWHHFKEKLFTIDKKSRRPQAKQMSAIEFGLKMKSNLI